MQHNSVPSPRREGASCFWTYFCFLDVPSDSGHLPALCFLVTKEKFCCHWAPRTAVPRWAVSPASPELCPCSLCRAPVWAGGTATRGHTRQPMTTAPAILNPLFITRMCFYPRYRADLCSPADSNTGASCLAGLEQPYNLTCGIRNPLNTAWTIPVTCARDDSDDSNSHITNLPPAAHTPSQKPKRKGLKTALQHTLKVNVTCIWLFMAAGQSLWCGCA